MTIEPNIITDLPATTTQEPQLPDTVKAAMTADKRAAIAEMKAGLHVAKTVIKVLGKLVDNINNLDPEALEQVNPLKLKQITETNFTALATIRKLRYIDQEQEAVGQSTDIDSMLKRIQSTTIAKALHHNGVNQRNMELQQHTTTKTRVVMVDTKDPAPREKLIS